MALTVFICHFSSLSLSSQSQPGSEQRAQKQTECFRVAFDRQNIISWRRDDVRPQNIRCLRKAFHLTKQQIFSSFFFSVVCVRGPRLEQPNMPIKFRNAVTEYWKIDKLLSKLWQMAWSIQWQYHNRTESNKLNMTFMALLPTFLNGRAGINTIPHHKSIDRFRRTECGRTRPHVFISGKCYWIVIVRQTIWQNEKLFRRKFD